MECDSQDCVDAGKLCNVLGAQFVADIDFEESKEPLDERVNRNHRIKTQQMKFYADDESILEEKGNASHWLK